MKTSFRFAFRSNFEACKKVWVCKLRLTWPRPRAVDRREAILLSACNQRRTAYRPEVRNHEAFTELSTKRKKCPVVKNILTRKQSAKKIKKKRLNSLLNQTGLFAAWRKMSSYHENVDLEAIRKHIKLHRIDCSTYRAFCICLIVWTALFDKRS